MPGIERIRTARLVGTRPLPRDAAALAPLLADERVAAWLWPGRLGGARTVAQVRAIVARDIDHWRRHGFGPWVVRDAADAGTVGRIGLMRTDVGGRSEVEVAWLVAPARWGEGLATEMARAALAVAFDDLGLADVVALTLPHNAASRAVMARLGMTYERELRHAGLPHVLYRRRAGGG